MNVRTTLGSISTSLALVALATSALGASPSFRAARLEEGAAIARHSSTGTPSGLRTLSDPQIAFQGFLTDSATGRVVPDGPQDLTLTLWDAPTDGTALWTEFHLAVPVVNGTFAIYLGSTTALPLGEFDGKSLYLGIRVGGSAELQPRTPLLASPYAIRSLVADRADTADVAIGDDGDWTVSGEDLFRLAGRVAVGTAEFDGAHDPQAALRVVGGNLIVEDDQDLPDLTLHAVGVQTAGDIRFHHDDASVGTIRMGGDPAMGATWNFQDRTSATISRLFISSNGNVGLGTTTPSEKLQVAGIVHSTVGGFKFPDGTVQTTAGVGDDGDWNVSGNDMSAGVSGNVGIGTSSPDAKLTIEAGGSGAPAIRMGNRDKVVFEEPGGAKGAEIFSGADSHLYIDNEVDGVGDVVLRVAHGTVEGMRVTSGGRVGVGTASPQQKLHARMTSSQDEAAAVFGESTAGAGATKGVIGVVNSPGAASGSAIGVYGVAAANGEVGGGSFGVLGRSAITDAAAGGGSAGVMGWAPGTSSGPEVQHDGFVHGVWGETLSRKDGVSGVTGKAIAATTGRTRGIYGATASTGAGAAGVQGYAPSGEARGVWGETSSATGIAVFAAVPNPSYTGIYNEGTYVGAGPITSVVKTTSGARQLFGPAASEAWCVEVGEGRLRDGRSRVDLDPRFLETVTVDDEYPLKVFVTLTGAEPANPVRVIKDRTGFVVEELLGGSSSATFDFFVMAKRAGSEGKRLEQYDVPEHMPILDPELAHPR